MALLAAAVWIILLAITGQQAECFNLDQNENVVRFFTGGNEPNSLFGFSLAPYSLSDNHTSILVGAPNESGFNDTRRTGAVYQCDLDSNDCSRLVPFESYTDQQVRNTIPPGFDSSTFALAHDDTEIRVDGQLLGYSLDAVNDFAITCAPHYSMTVDPTRFNADNDLVNIPQYDGRCVVLRHNENISTPYTQFPFISILGPYTTTLRSFGTSVKLASTDNNIELFSSSLLSGSSDHPFGRLYTLTLDPLSSSFSDSSNSRRTERGVNGYLGFHIEVGYITINRSSSDNPQVIASAPRDELHQGSVSVWNDVYQTSVFSVFGEETDGYFGYDFAALPQSENGYDNLVVGCPLCSEERGMVYYYPNNNGILNTTAVKKIPAPNENHKGRFGISVESIGDLDRDGYNDVAIAAPLEVGQRDDGTYYTGVVYIFRGDSMTSILTDYSQVVYGYSSVPLFGYSLSGGRDLDDNDYPDLVVGGVSTSSNSDITLLRAAPVVTVEAEIITLNEPLVLNNQLYQCIVEGETTVSCFNVSVCFYYSLLPGDSVDRFKIMYTLSSDSRVFTNRSDINSDSSISKEFTIIDGENTTQCELHTVYLQPNIAQLTDVMFQLSIADSNDPVVLQSGLHPVLNIGRTTEWTQSVELNSTCADIICRPELELHVSYTGTTPVYLNKRFNIPFNITVVNNGVEDGFAFKVMIKLPYRGIIKLTEVPYQNDSLQSSCVPSLTDSLVIECPIKSPLGAKENISFELVLVQIVDDIQLNTSALQFDFELSDEQNADIDPSNNVILNHTEEVRSVARYGTSITAGGADPLVALQSSFLLNQFTRLTNIPTDPTELGPLSPIEIVIRNDDNSESLNTNSPISSSEVFIFWPSEITVQTSGEDVQFPFLVPLPQQLQPSQNTLCMYHELFPSSLSDEELANASIPSAATPPSREFYPEYCDKNIKCGVIICEVSDLAPDGNVTRIFINSVLFSPSVTGNQDVNISVLVRNKDAYPEVEDTMTTLTLRVHTAVSEVAENCVNIWIPIVAATGGFIILVIIAVLLGFLGFFTHQNRFKRYLEERRGVHTFDDDESYAPRIVVPEYEYEAIGEPQLVSFGRRPPSCDASIRDEPGISNGNISPLANGYNPRSDNMLEGRTDTIQLTMRTDHRYSTPSPQGVMMEYTDSDIITTTSSQRSLDKLPNNVTHPRLSSPTVSLSSKETEI